METGTLPPIGRIWRACGYDFERDPDQDEPELYACADETPLLVVPAAISDRDLETEFHAAVSRLYLKRYGEAALVAGIRSWDAIVERLGLREVGD